MKLSYTTLFVKDVHATIAFYEKAFGLTKGMVVPTGEYGEMLSGNAKLAFASDVQALSNGIEFELQHQAKKSPAMEIGFICENVEEAYAKAVQAGAKPAAAPKAKPWGQTVAYVLDNNGFLIELGTAMAD